MEDPVLPTPRKLGAGPETGPAAGPPSGAIPIEAGSGRSRCVRTRPPVVSVAPPQGRVRRGPYSVKPGSHTSSTLR
jgi:hypothetical protein